MADTSACRCPPCCSFSCSGRYIVVVASASRTQRQRRRQQHQVWVTVVTPGLQPKPLHSLLPPAAGCISRSLKRDALLPKATTVVAAAAAEFPWSIGTNSQEAAANHRAAYAGCTRSSRRSASSKSLQRWPLHQQQHQHKRIDQPIAGRKLTVSRYCRQREPRQLPLASAARLWLLLPALILVWAGTIASGAPLNAGPIELHWAGARSPVEAPAAWQQAAHETGHPCAAQSSEHSRAEGEERKDKARGLAGQHDTGSLLGQTGPGSSPVACASFLEPSHANGNRLNEQDAAAASADLAKAAEALATSKPTSYATAAAAAAAPPTQLSIVALDEYARRDTKHGTGDNEPASQQVHMKAAVTPATGTVDDAKTHLRMLQQPTRPSAAAVAATPLTETQQLLIGAPTIANFLVQPRKAEGEGAAAHDPAPEHDAVPSDRSAAASADTEFSLLQQTAQNTGIRTATVAPNHSEASLFHADNTIGTNAEAATDENPGGDASAAAAVMTANGDSKRSSVSDRRVGGSSSSSSNRHTVTSSTADPTAHRATEAAGRARGLHVPRVQAVRQLDQEPVPELLQVAPDAAATAVGTASVDSYVPSTGSSAQAVGGWITTSPGPAAAAEAAATLETTATAAAAAGHDRGASTEALPGGRQTTADQQQLATATEAVAQSATAAESHDRQLQKKPSDSGTEDSSRGSSNLTNAADVRLRTEERGSLETVTAATDSRASFSTSVEPVRQQQQLTTAVVPSRSTAAGTLPTSRLPNYHERELQPCEEAGCTSSSGQPQDYRPNAAESAAAIAAVGTTGRPEPTLNNDGRGNWAIGTVAGAAAGGLAAMVWLIGVPLAYVFCRRRHRHLRRSCRRARTDNREARYEQHRTEHSHLEELIMLELAKARSRGYVCDSDKVNYDEVFHLNASVANQITTEL